MKAFDKSWVLDNQVATSTIFKSTEETSEEKKFFLKEIISDF